MSDSLLQLAPEPLSGTKLGRYEVVCRLSTGGMSEIFLAYQRGVAGFRKLVVLKQILPDIKSDEKFVRMFLNEAKLAAAFSHPNIAQVYDLDVDGNALFLAMEFVPGATLVEVARECRESGRQIPVGFTLAAIRDTAMALHYAHTYVTPLGEKMPVIHRDIAEKNIMVTYDGATKLLDFGVAKSVQPAWRTAVGVLKGSAGYMSPEQLRGDTLDARSDVFSLGVVLHELLTGVRLFHAGKLEDELVAPMRVVPSPPSRKNREVPPELDRVTFRALEKDRNLRFQSGFELARALEEAGNALIWRPDQIAAFMQSLFAKRREQTRRLFAASEFKEGTAELNLDGLLSELAPKRTPAGGLRLRGPSGSVPSYIPRDVNTDELAVSQLSKLRGPAEATLPTGSMGENPLSTVSLKQGALEALPTSAEHEHEHEHGDNLPYARRTTRPVPKVKEETAADDDHPLLARRDFASTAVIHAVKSEVSDPGSSSAELLESGAYEIIEELSAQDEVTGAVELTGLDVGGKTEIGRPDLSALGLALPPLGDAGAGTESHLKTEFHPLRGELLAPLPTDAAVSGRPAHVEPASDEGEPTGKGTRGSPYPPVTKADRAAYPGVNAAALEGTEAESVDVGGTLTGDGPHSEDSGPHGMLRPSVRAESIEASLSSMLAREASPGAEPGGEGALSGGVDGTSTTSMRGQDSEPRRSKSSERAKAVALSAPAIQANPSETYDGVSRPPPRELPLEPAPTSITGSDGPSPPVERSKAAALPRPTLPQLPEVKEPAARVSRSPGIEGPTVRRKRGTDLGTQASSASATPDVPRRGKRKRSALRRAAPVLLLAAASAGLLLSPASRTIREVATRARQLMQSKLASHEPQPAQPIVIRVPAEEPPRPATAPVTPEATATAPSAKAAPPEMAIQAGGAPVPTAEQKATGEEGDRPTEAPLDDETLEDADERLATNDGPRGSRAAEETGTRSKSSKRRTGKAMGSGRLFLRTTPDSIKVFLGPRFLGTTPLKAVPLPAGTHSLRLESRARERRRLVVKIPSGGRSSLEVRFRSLPRE